MVPIIDAHMLNHIITDQQKVQVPLDDRDLDVQSERCSGVDVSYIHLDHVEYERCFVHGSVSCGDASLESAMI